MDGRHAENAGAFFGCPGMADMQQMQEHVLCSRRVPGTPDLNAR
jgi:hypothetical protein